MMKTLNTSSKAPEQHAWALSAHTKQYRESIVAQSKTIKTIIDEVINDILRHHTRYLPKDSTFHLINWDRKLKALTKVLQQHQDELNENMDKHPEYFI